MEPYHNFDTAGDSAIEFRVVRSKWEEQSKSKTPEGVDPAWFVGFSPRKKPARTRTSRSSRRAVKSDGTASTHLTTSAKEVSLRYRGIENTATQGIENRPTHIDDQLTSINEDAAEKQKDEPESVPLRVVKDDCDCSDRNLFDILPEVEEKERGINNIEESVDWRCEQIEQVVQNRESNVMLEASRVTTDTVGNCGEAEATNTPTSLKQYKKDDGIRFGNHDLEQKCHRSPISSVKCEKKGEKGKKFVASFTALCRVIRKLKCRRAKHVRSHQERKATKPAE